jgi:molybdopterin converting factor small subunit
MYISVTFLGLQRAKAQSDQIQIRFPQKTRVADVWAYIKKNHPELPFPEDAMLVAVNNKVSSMEKMLKNKDNVTFLPFLGGG